MATIRKNGLGLIIALAVMLHALMPFFATYQPASHNAATLSAAKMTSLFGDKILICTASGFALVSIKDLLSGKAPVKPHNGLMCALCYMGASDMGKALMVALAWLACLGLLGVQARAMQRSELLLSTQRSCNASPRAPPALGR